LDDVLVTLHGADPTAPAALPSPEGACIFPGQATDRMPTGCPDSWAASMRSSSGQQPPQRDPARQRSAISRGVRAPAAIAASMVRSVTALQLQTYTPRSSLERRLTPL